MFRIILCLTSKMKTNWQKKRGHYLSKSLQLLWNICFLQFVFWIISMFLDKFIHKLFKMHVSIMYSAHNCSETHQPPAIEISTYFYSTTNIFITIYYLLILILFEKMPRISVDNIYSSSRQVRKWSAQIVSKLLLTSWSWISVTI